MPQRRIKTRRYPFTVHCSECDNVLIEYAEDAALADIKFAGKGWMRNPNRCRECVVVIDQKRTGVLEAGT